VLTPLALGHDAHGSAARRVRGGIDMARRRKAAHDARALAATLRAIEDEPLAPDVVLSVRARLARDVADGSGRRAVLVVHAAADALERLADGLEAEPDLSEAPGLASRKPGWRGYLREVVAALGDLGFRPREVDMVRLVAVLCRALACMPPSRDAVRDALRAGRAPNPEPSHRCQ
jgi:hypothetical protein